jgi:serine/threonine protein kinase
MSRYIIDADIYSGIFEVKVKLCYDTVEQRTVVMKTFPKTKEASETFFNERYFLSFLQKHSVMKIEDVWETKENYTLILERADSDLYDYLSRKGALTEQELIRNMKGILETLVFMHENKILHNDIKLENIVVKDQKLYFIDFGLSERINHRESQKSAGSEYYVAPEVLLGMPHGFAADIYSLGVTMFAALSWSFPYDFKDPMDYRKNQIEGNLNMDILEEKKVSSWVVDLVRKMLDPCARRRPTAQEIVAQFTAAEAEAEAESESETDTEFKFETSKLNSELCNS